MTRELAQWRGSSGPAGGQAGVSAPAGTRRVALGLRRAVSSVELLWPRPQEAEYPDGVTARPCPPRPPWRVLVTDRSRDGSLTSPAAQGLPVLHASQEPSIGSRRA